MVQIKSMTGFGSSDFENDIWNIKTEIKSLNNKFLELNIRMPKSFKDKEIELRQHLNTKIQRGSVSISIIAERKDNSSINDTLSVNLPLAKSYFDKLNVLSSALGMETPNLLQTIIAFPDVVKYEETEVSEEDWQLIMGTVDGAFLKFDDFRMTEGATISKYIIECIVKIRELVKTVEAEEIPRRESIKGKLLQSLLENKEDISMDQNRFEQEIIYYLEKYDIGEEKSRLGHHLDFFVECLEKDASGKKLNFIAQEMGREINTMGSKAYYFPIQQSVVLMKEELEKIKEQLLNVL
ncbi:MAG: YicC family protein [Bacteroidia bacterium]|nr:YicC family protein [Bacteroidia bacterium]